MAVPISPFLYTYCYRHYFGNRVDCEKAWKTYKQPAEETALDILKKGHVRREINKEEYERMRKDVF